MPFGVELPTSFPTDSAPASAAPSQATDNAPDVAKEPSTPESQSLDKQTPEQLLDLDKHERFRFQGRETTLKELIERQMMRDDYSRKTAQVAEARKFADNFDADASWVLEDPTRLGKFKEVYPPGYVKILEKLISRLPTEPGQAALETATPATAALPPDVAKEIEDMREWRHSVQSQISEAKAAKADAELTSWFDELSKKFPDAENDVVTARAAVTAERLEAEGKEFSKSHLEKLFKEDHDLRVKRQTERARAQQKEQKAVAKKSQDMGGGGGVAGQAPASPKNFKEAQALMERDFKAGRLS